MRIIFITLGLLLAMGLTLFFLPREWQVSVHDSFGETWKRAHKQHKKRVKKLKAQLDQKEIEGGDFWCLRQKVTEVSWLVSYTDREEEIKKRLSSLEKEIQEGRVSNEEEQQSPDDGSWGRCFTEWFFKFDRSVDYITALSHQGKSPKYSLKFLDSINSPEKLNSYLEEILISDLRTQRVDHRKELNYVVPGLVKLTRKQSIHYKFHPELRQTLLKFIAKWQNPETGWWGAWYRENGKIIKTDDLSITFHLASYLNGEVPLKDKIARTLLERKPLPYPYGLMEYGKYTTHHNYDGVRLLRYAWPELSPKEQKDAAEEIHKMLGFALKEVIQEDGSIVISPADDSLGDAYYFTVSFLDEVGYFAKSKRFWTEEEFPQAEALRKKIVGKIESIKPQTLMLKDALKKLSSNRPQ
jgi:hypothetical protein